jgi:hypothetical protein
MSEQTPISKKKVDDKKTPLEPTNKIKKPPAKKRVVKNSKEAAAFFGRQYTSSADLPDPEPSLISLATGVFEVISGTRQIDQLARILSDGVYQTISKKAIEARAARESRGEKARYENIRFHAIRNQSPRDGVIESVVLVDIHQRTKAVAIRLEGINSRWRATSVSVL